MSEDPIGFRGKDINVFRYVGNNPLIFKDPDGLRQNTAENGGIPEEEITAVWVQIGFGDCLNVSFNNAFYSNPGKQIPVKIVDPNSGQTSIGSGCIFACSGVMGFGACKKVEPTCENQL